MADQREDPAEARWEQAYLQQCHDAAVGRMFRGIVHNLNGALQVFSLQIDLFAMAGEQADALSAQLLVADLDPAAKALTEELVGVLGRRSDAVRQLRDKLRTCEATIQRTLVLPDFTQVMGTEPYTVNSVLRTELEFLAADSFFKHKVVKDLQPAVDPPPLREGQLALHQILFFLLENSLAAVRGLEQPRIVVRALCDGEGTTVVVEDNGPGVPPEERERIFAPFHTTWPGHLGLGLYLARMLVADLRGDLVCEAGPEGAAFRLTFPAA